MASSQGASPLRVLVAVHGIGDQTKFETLQGLVNLCFGHYGRPKGVPIGYLHSRIEAGQAWASVPDLPDFGFAEVFWADIGRRHEQYTLEDARRWTDTIVGRLEVLDLTTRTPPPLPPLDFVAIRRTLGDFNLAVGLIRMLNRGLTTLGFGDLQVDKMLRRYLGDVQLFAEFELIRGDIMARFSTTMAAIERAATSTDREVEIHICGHSQGSVVAFLGLLNGHALGDAWCDRVRTFMTIGSPIDTFLILWPHLWRGAAAPRPRQHRPIRWCNYADRGDPIGYGLEIAQRYVGTDAPGLFASRDPRNLVFRRYSIPGKAHIDYWRDQAVFDHWMDDMNSRPAPPLRDRALARLLAPILPFAVALGGSFAAAHFVAAMLEGIATARDPSHPSKFDLGSVVVIALFLFGSVTLLGASRATRKLRWLVAGIVLFLSGSAGLYLWFGTNPYALAIAAVMGAGGILQNWSDRRRTYA